MRSVCLFFFLFFQLCIPDSLVAKSRKNEESFLHNWKKNTILTPTHRKPARTAVLIIEAPILGDDYTGNRWKLGKKTWEQYMNSHSNIDCYFIRSTNPKPEWEGSNQVWLEENTIYIGDSWYAKYSQDRILHKTIAAMERLLPNYTHFIRTNLNTFLNLKSVNEYMETHHQSFFSTPLWQNEWYAVGYSILCTADVAAHIVNEYRRLEVYQHELVSSNQADDAVITALATGVWPLNKKHPFRCCPTLPFAVRQLMCDSSLTPKRLSRYGAYLLPPISLEGAIHYCEAGLNTMMVYRIREGLNLKDLAQFYQYLLLNTYPGLRAENLLEYTESIANKK